MFKLLLIIQQILPRLLLPNGRTGFAEVTFDLNHKNKKRIARRKRKKARHSEEHQRTHEGEAESWMNLGAEEEELVKFR